MNNNELIEIILRGRMEYSPYEVSIADSIEVLKAKLRVIPEAQTANKALVEKALYGQVIKLYDQVYRDHWSGAASVRASMLNDVTLSYDGDYQPEPWEAL